MPSISRRKQIFAKHVEPMRAYSIDEGLALLQACHQEMPTKFNQTITAAIRLGIDPKKSDQAVRGAVVLPNGTGQAVKVMVFAQGDKAAEATAAGADIVGGAEMVDEIKKNGCSVDVVIATPDMMASVGKLGTILGPKGLMPNPKEGTVTQDITKAVTNAKSGQVKYRAEKAGIVHATLGKIDFSTDALTQNLQALLEALRKARPENAKGVYLRKVTIASSMGPGVIIDPSSINSGS